MESSAYQQAENTSNKHAVTLDQTKQPRLHRFHPVGMVLWFLGLVLLVIGGIIVHNHPTTWSLEQNVINVIQGPHPVPCPVSWHASFWENEVAYFINTLNDPMEAVIIPVAWMIVVMLFRWFLQAISLGIAVLTSSLWWAGLGTLVARPRATVKDGVCVYRAINAYSFPSGHVIHDVVLYGFLLYLSFSRPVRQWRYRWILLPFQIVMILYMLAVGYARLLAGEHHFFDVLGGYLAGILWLCLFIFLYRWVANLLTKRHLNKMALG